MIDSPLAWAFVVAGAFAAGFVNGLTGFGTALTALPIWLHVLAPALASPLIVACSVLGQLQTLPAIWPTMNFRRLAPFVAGGLFGVPIGTVLLHRVDVNAFKIGIGALLVVSCSLLLWRGPRAPMRAGGRGADAMVGFAGGILGGLAGLSGILPTLWTELRGWERDERRAVFQGFNLSILAVALVSQGFGGFLTADLGRLLVVAAPVTMLGVWIGHRLYARLDSRRFSRMVLIVLLVAGSILSITGILPKLRSS